MSYGLSKFYQGDLGTAYFAYQNRSADSGGALNAEKFRELIDSAHSVLDFGCGGGWLLKHLAAARCVGIEPNLAAQQQCRANGIEVYASVDQLPALLFDRIISHHALEHVPYPIEALRQLGERLAADGRLILVLPIDDWRTERDHTGRDKDHHLHTWTPRLIANTLVDAGLEPVEVRIVTHAWPPRWEMWDRLLPRPMFHALCWLWSIALRRRQLLAIAAHAAGGEARP
jgi:SAM-dependent methyltransferase